MLNKEQNAMINRTVELLKNQNLHSDFDHLTDQIKNKRITIQSLERINQIEPDAIALFKKCSFTIANNFLLIDPTRPLPQDEVDLLERNRLIVSNALIEHNLTSNNTTQQAIEEGKQSIKLRYREYIIQTNTVGRELIIFGYPLTERGKILFKIMTYRDQDSESFVLQNINHFIQFLVALPAFRGSYQFDIYQQKNDRLLYVKEITPLDYY